MKKNNKGFSLVELIVVVLIMAIIATALTLAVTKYVAKSKRSSDANTAGELKTAAETAVTDYITSVDALKAGTITIKGVTDSSKSTGFKWDWDNVGSGTGVKVGTTAPTFQTIFESAAGDAAPKSKVHPDDTFVITVTVAADESAKYEVNYVKTDNSTDIFAAATK